MTHSIVLEIPESIYQPLAQEAELKGLKIEDIALERLANDKTKSVDDSLDKFIGAFDSGGSDWAHNHDKYLGEELGKDLKLKR